MRLALVEIKSTDRVTERDVATIKNLAKDMVRNAWTDVNKILP